MSLWTRTAPLHKQGLRRVLIIPAVFLAGILAMLMAVTATVHAQQDRRIDSAPRAGQPIAGLTPAELSFFTNVGLPTFSEVDGVGDGLGPRFNLNSCAGCHAFPAVGGSSPPAQNPQVVNAPMMAPGNRVPRFLQLNGPVREVRFIKKRDGTPDGGVTDIFTITGRPDAPRGCSIDQPDFSNEDNMIFRIPTPVFGAGLIEEIPDKTILDNLRADPTGDKARLGISGRVNRNGNDGTITRFGWKAQNKSLMVFSGEAYNVEIGVTNENFQNEREEDTRCATNGTPESPPHFDGGATELSDITAFTGFMRFLAPPAPACTGFGCPPSVQNGRRLFLQIGCALCHTPTLMTGLSSTAALNRRAANLFSDLAVHSMGTGLADGITQGAAGPDEFRTAPLWGVGQRAFFLHDGRTTSLMQAILAHGSPRSEAQNVTRRFSSLTNDQMDDLIDFLRSL